MVMVSKSKANRVMAKHQARVAKIDKAIKEATKNLQAKNKEQKELIDKLCSQEPCPKCGYGVTGACYGCEIKRLRELLKQVASDELETATAEWERRKNHPASKYAREVRYWKDILSQVKP